MFFIISAAKNHIFGRGENFLKLGLKSNGKTRSGNGFFIKKMTKKRKFF